MSATAPRPGVWGLVEARPAAHPVNGTLWKHLTNLIDTAEYRPTLAADIEVKRFQGRGDEAYFMVANPRDLVHFRLGEHDFGLLRYMDGTRTVKEIVLERFQESGEMELADLADLVYQLRTENFLEDRFVDVDAMVERAMSPNRRREKVRKFLTSLRIEWEAPGRLVKWLHDHGLRWTLTRPFMVLSLFLSLGGIYFFAQNVRKGLFGLTGHSLAIGFFVLLGLQYFMVFVHEVGHALVLIHNGRRMKSAGFQIYFGCPAFFVESSDGLMMDRRQRILQAFAGPYAQSLGAGMASLLAWAFPQWAVSETLYRYTVLAYLNIFLNLVPLLELDGYWMLSDWLRIPDLRPRSIQFVQHDFLHKLRTRERWTAGEFGLLFYGIFGAAASVLLFISGYIFWRILFGGLVITLWRSGVQTRIILAALALFILNPIIRGLINAARAAVRRLRARWRRITFRLERRWRVEAAELIDRLPLFEDLPEDALSELAGRVRLGTFRAGQPVVRQGDPADAFYLVRRGVLRVVEEDPASGEEVRTLRTLGPGEGFGELGLAEGAARGATVRAAEDSELFEIDKGTFDELLADTLRVPRFAPTLQAAAELGRIPAFGHLQPDELGELLRAGRWVNVPPGAVMVEQGAVGDAFFAISSGQAQVFENGTNVRNLGPGSHFGEIALLLDVPRTATVKAMTPVRAFRLEREGFDGLLRSSFQKGTLDPTLPLERVLDH